MSARVGLARLGSALAIIGTVAGCAGGRPAEVPADEQLSVAPPSSAAKVQGSGGGEPRLLFEEEAASGPGAIEEPVVERGTGRLVGQPRARAAAGVRVDEAGDITLNVVDGDIREVVRLVLDEGLGANYVIDPAVTGTITVRTSRPVPAADVLAILNSVLNLNGAALVQQGDLYKVVPLDQAAAGAMPGTRLSAKVQGASSGIQVAPLRYADAAELAELLQPFVANQGTVQVDPARNTLLLLGSADQVATMSDLIDMFDVDWMAGMSFGLYPLDAATPAELADELDQVFGDPEAGVGAGGVRFVPLDRLGALLVITAEPDYLARAERWIERLDRPGDGGDDQVYVYAVQNGRASDLAAVLGELFDLRSTAIGEPTLVAPGLEPIELRPTLPTFEPERTGDEGTAGSAARRAPERRPPVRTAEGGFGGGFGEDGGRRELTEGSEALGTRIVADETNNALLIRGKADDYRKILKALQELDRLPLQVLLEATIAEVSLEDELSYGVRWFFGSGDSGVTFSDLGNGAVAPTFPGFSGILSSGDVRAVISALDSVSDVQVISSPQLLVLDNQTAQLEVGDEVPIVTQQAVGIDTGDARIVNSVELRQTGVILSVTPRVNANGLVVLDIQQEVSDVVRTDTSGIDSPTIAQRRIGTSVVVGSDQTVVLGGLIQDDVNEVRAGVPYLKDIPVLGWLFGASSTITTRTELLVLITPKVLTNQQEAVLATEELRRRLRAVAPLEAKVRALETETGAGDRPSSGFAVELASVPNEADAWQAWQALEREHPAHFVGLQPRVERAETADGVTYRLRVGPFDDVGDARRVCASLTQAGADCLVIDR